MTQIKIFWAYITRIIWVYITRIIWDCSGVALVQELNFSFSYNFSTEVTLILGITSASVYIVTLWNCLGKLHFQ